MCLEGDTRYDESVGIYDRAIWNKVFHFVWQQFLNLDGSHEIMRIYPIGIDRTNADFI